ncbi:MAG: right-handed parallel beta-helix repeat-containing protein [Candidatus Marinimicrobia bacterium]|nr:right-handed parallel beta-helix repeat-containing protein [Candidatus Neomarinimicrobiota bacterium]
MKIIVKCIIILLISLSLKSAILYTPNGKTVPTHDAYAVAYDASYFAAYAANNFGSGNLYPNSEVLGTWEDNMWEYNCHVFAWNNWQGAERWNDENDMWTLGQLSPLNLLWRNYPDIWYEDSDNPLGIVSYIQTTIQGEASIVTYRKQSDPEILHSARIVGDGSKYISKWGSMPIIKHPPTETPVDGSGNSRYGVLVNYYKINPAYRPIGGGDPAGRDWETISNALINTSSGDVISILSGTQSLVDDIVIPQGVELNVKSSAIINLGSSNSITTSNGTIIMEAGADINPNIYHKSASNIKGYYPTIALALTAASSGDTIKVNSTETLNNNITIPSGVTLKINNEGEINLGSYTITGDVEVESQGSLNPYICVENTSTDKYFPTTTSAVSYISEPWAKLILNGEYTLTQDLTIEEFQLEIGPKSNITLPDGYDLVIDWINNGSLSSLNANAKFSPDIRSIAPNLLVTGFYSNIANAFSAESLVEVRDTLIASSDLTVPSGKTLKTLDNCVTKIPYGNNLDVYGTLNAYGTTFTGSSTTWAGIEFKQGSGGTINTCEFDNAALGININYASPTIHDNLVSDCGYGIRIYGNTSNPNVYDNMIWDCNYGFYVRSTDANIHDNGVYDCSVYGLYLYSTSPDIYDNEIENSRVYMNSCYSELTNNYIHGTTSSGCTMYIYNSDPYFFNNTITAEDDFTIETSNSYVCFGLDGQQGPPDCYGLNVLDNDEGNDGVVYAVNGSEVILGYGDCGLYDCGYNSIYNRNYPLWTDGSSTIWAWDCYWGDTNAPNCVGDVEIGDELNDDPDDVGSSLAKSLQSSESVREIISTEDSLYRYAYELMVESNYSLSLTVLEDIITNYQESNYAFRALNLSLRLCNKFETANTEEWLTKLSGIVDNDDLSEIIDLKRVSNYQKSKKINEAIVLSESISRKSNNKHEASTLFNLFNFYQKDKGDIDEAEKYFEKLKEKYPNHKLTLIACSDMNEDYYSESLAKALVADDGFAEEVTLPETFKVHSAYPNPFNPSTTLEFDLPVAAKVECCIFDLRGNLIKNYKYNKQAGTHRITWSGSNVSSGIYLIRFVAEASDGSESFVDYQKVTLLK